MRMSGRSSGIRVRPRPHLRRGPRSSQKDAGFLWESEAASSSSSPPLLSDSLSGTNSRPAPRRRWMVSLSGAQRFHLAGSRASGYRCYLNAQNYELTNGESQLFAASKSAFDAFYLQTEIGHQVVFALATTKHPAVTPEQLTEARASLSSQITGVMNDVGNELRSLQNACGSNASDSASTFWRAFLPHSSPTRSVSWRQTMTWSSSNQVSATVRATSKRTSTNIARCSIWTVIRRVIPNAGRGRTLADNNPGVSFGKAAFGTGGGKQACVTASTLRSGLRRRTSPASHMTRSHSLLRTMAGYVLLQITSQKPSSLDAVRAQVRLAVKANGSPSNTSALSTALRDKASVWVDPREGLAISVRHRRSAEGLTGGFAEPADTFEALGQPRGPPRPCPTLRQ